MPAEQPHLLPLPACDFDTAQVVYRHVNVEGYVAYRLELLLGALVVHRPGAAGAHHRGRSHHLLHRPGRDRPPSARARHARRRCVRRSRAIIPPTIRASGPCCCGNASANSVRSPCTSSTACSPSRSRANSKPSNCWRCWRTYQRDDVLEALERAVRFGAFSLAAVRRILAARAKPKPLLDELADLHRDALDPSLRQEPVGPRPTSDYQHLLSRRGNR